MSRWIHHWIYTDASYHFSALEVYDNCLSTLGRICVYLEMNCSPAGSDKGTIADPGRTLLLPVILGRHSWTHTCPQTGESANGFPYTNVYANYTGTGPRRLYHPSFSWIRHRHYSQKHYKNVDKIWSKDLTNFISILANSLSTLFAIYCHYSANLWRLIAIFGELHPSFWRMYHHHYSPKISILICTGSR